MKKVLIGAYTGLIVLIACTPKASPTATNATIPVAADVSSSPAAIEAGQVIFTTKCTKCHAAKNEAVASKTYEELRPILASMSKKSHLSSEEIKQVSAYVFANAKK